MSGITSIVGKTKFNRQVSTTLTIKRFIPSCFIVLSKKLFSDNTTF